MNIDKRIANFNRLPRLRKKGYPRKVRRILQRIRLEKDRNKSDWLF